MDLRPASWADIPRVVDLTCALVAAIDGPQVVDRAHAGKTVAGLIQSEDGCVFLTPGGFIAGALLPTVISPALVAQELGWFATDRSGVRLLRAFERWAAEKGAAMIAVSTAGYDLSRLGYRRAEQAWVR